MIFKTLENTSIKNLVAVFNESFKNYFVKIVLTEEILSNKIISEDVDLSLSAGAFENGRLVGFILHAVRDVEGIKTAYNAGTGVVEECRGKSLTVQLYQYILPRLKASGVQKCVLEVISENIPAIKSYQKAGFKIIRDLECFKGTTQAKHKDEVSFRNISGEEWASLRDHWDWQPTWQHSVETVQKLDSYQHLGILLQSQVVGYCIFNPAGRVVQFCVNKGFREQGLGKMLFSEVNRIVNTDLSVINVDGYHQGSVAFLEKIGLTKTLKQYAMELSIS